MKKLFVIAVLSMTSQFAAADGFWEAVGDSVGRAVRSGIVVRAPQQYELQQRSSCVRNGDGGMDCTTRNVAVPVNDPRYTPLIRRKEESEERIIGFQPPQQNYQQIRPAW